MRIASSFGPESPIRAEEETEKNFYHLVTAFCSCSLLEHCRRHRYLSQSGEELALLLSSLLENLLAYRTITQDESPEHRMSCTVNVLVHTHTHTRVDRLAEFENPSSTFLTHFRISTKRRRGRTFTFGE